MEDRLISCSNWVSDCDCVCVCVLYRMLCLQEMPHKYYLWQGNGMTQATTTLSTQQWIYNESSADNEQWGLIGELLHHTDYPQCHNALAGVVLEMWLSLWQSLLYDDIHACHVFPLVIVGLCDAGFYDRSIRWWRTRWGHSMRVGAVTESDIFASYMFMRSVCVCRYWFDQSYCRIVHRSFRISFHRFRQLHRNVLQQIIRFADLCHESRQEIFTR